MFLFVISVIVSVICVGMGSKQLLGVLVMDALVSTQH